jgi:DNA-binding MarR family transcriptional regulator
MPDELYECGNPGPISSRRASEPSLSDDDLTDLLARVPLVVGQLRRMEPPPGTFRDTFAAHGLGPRHSRVLMVVMFRGELSVSAVAKALDVSLPAASLLIGELDRAGLLIRVEDARDRRRTLVRVHPDSEREARGWLEARVAPWRATLAQLSPRDRRAFLAGWRILQTELATARTADPSQSEGPVPEILSSFGEGGTLP